MATRQVSLHRLGQFLDAKIERLHRLRDNGRPRAMEAARKEILANLTRSFDQSVTPDGIPWVPTIYNKPVGTILIDTNTMRSEAFAAVRAARILNDSLIVPFDQTSYGILHQHGQGSLPARPWYGLRQEQVEKITRAAAQEVCRALTGKR